MTEFLVSISDMLTGAPVVALTAALLWGLASVVFSPCHLVSIPLLVGYLNARNPTRTVDDTVLSLLFSAGILLTIALIGVGTALAGRMLGDMGSATTYVAGALLIMFGLYMMGLLRLPAISTATAARIPLKNGFSIFLVGLVFGIGLGPCTFAFMAPVLALVLGSAAERLWLSAGLLTAFAIGHSAVIVVAGSLSQAVRRYLSWDSRSQMTAWVQRVCGALITAGGIYLVVA